MIYYAKINERKLSMYYPNVRTYTYTLTVQTTAYGLMCSAYMSDKV